jgi:hypothetical protein
VAYLAETESAMASEIGAHFIDLTAIYARVSEQMYTDYAHLTPSGNSRLADVIVDRLAEVIRADMNGRCSGGLSAPACGMGKQPGTR